jgi:hypothetical protein
MGWDQVLSYAFWKYRSGDRKQELFIILKKQQMDTRNFIEGSEISILF